MVGLPNVREIIIKLLFKWISVPVGILVTCMAGAALNLNDRFGEVSNLASDTMQQFMLMSVQLGYYFGIVPGLLVDKLPAKMIPMVVAALISAVSFGGLAFTVGADFAEVPIQILTVLCMFLAGFAASMATMTSMVTIVGNFKSKKVNVMLAGLIVTYMKLAPAFEDALKEAFFDEVEDRMYLIIVGVIVTIIFVIGAFTLKEADLPMILDKLSPTTDPSAAFVFQISTAIFLLTYWVVVLVLLNATGGVVVIIFFLTLNFLMLGLSIFMIYKIVKSGKMPSLELSLSKPPPDKTLGEMFSMPKYIFLCLAGMCLIGAASSYQENSVRLAAEAGDIGGISRQKAVYWLTDALGRFGGGFLGYAVADHINGYLFLVFGAICSIIGNIVLFMILGLDIDGGFFVLTAAFFLGLGVGLTWVSQAQILIDDAGETNYGSIWGGAILFGYIGVFLFDLLAYNVGLGLFMSFMYMLMGVLAFVFAFLAWSGDKKEKGGDGKAKKGKKGKDGKDGEKGDKGKDGKKSPKKNKSPKKPKKAKA